MVLIILVPRELQDVETFVNGTVGLGRGTGKAGAPRTSHSHNESNVPNLCWCRHF
jgi:hypothetical protein